MRLGCGIVVVMNLKRLAEYVLMVGLFLAPFIPLIVTDSLFFPFITGKAFALRILIEILFGIWAVLALLYPEYRPRRSGMFLALGALLVILTAATLLGENPYRSFWSNFERMEGLVTFLHLFVYFVLLISVFKRERLWYWFFHTFLGVGVILVLHSFAQMMGWASITQGAVRINSSLGNASYFAVTLLFLVFLTLVYATESWGKRRGITFLYGLFALIQIFFLFNTQTRGATLGLLGGFLISFLFIAWRERRLIMLQRTAIGLLVALVVFGGVFVVLRDQPLIRNNEVLTRLADISFSAGQSRFLIWGVALKGFKERPVLGWGPENFNLVFDKYYDPGLYDQEQWFDRAHNIFLDWLIHTGILGLMAYLALFVLAFYYLWRIPEFSVAKKSLLAGLFLAYMFHNVFVFDHLVSYLFFFALLAYLHVSWTRPVFPTAARPAARMLSRPALPVAAGIAVIVVVVLVYQLNLKPLRANRQLITAISAPILSEKFTAFQKIFASGTFATNEASEHLPNLVVMLFRDINASAQVKEDWSQFAVATMTREMERVKTARVPYLLGILQNYLNHPAEAANALEQARSLSPRKQQILSELAAVYANVGDKEKALALARESYELEPNNNEARLIYAVIAVIAGKFDIADSLVMSDEVPDARLINAYAKLKRYDRVLRLWQQTVNLQPTNIQARLSLAATYLALEQRGRAIAELERAIEIDPTVKNQAEFLINEIRAGRNPLE